MLFEGGFSFTNFLADLVTLFAFLVWFWLLITIFGDLFRRHDISGWGKAAWVIVVILTSYLGVLVYLITQGRGMAERNAQHARQARDELRQAIGFSVADEIEKLDRLRTAGTITDQEFAQLRAKLVQAT
jgi:Phospholipase_D-nuclease N-terminal/Short C-terminal domain